MGFNEPDIALSLSSPGQVLAELGKRARAERFRRRLTQAELAAAAGVARRTISRLEAGEPVGTDVLVVVAFTLRSERGLNQLFASPDARSVDEVLESNSRMAAQRVRVRRSR